MRNHQIGWKANKKLEQQEIRKQLDLIAINGILTGRKIETILDVLKTKAQTAWLKGML